jgi:membrane fusion protein, multidrug efflux system
MEETAMPEATDQSNPAVPPPELNEQATFRNRVRNGAAWAFKNIFYLLLAVLGLVAVFVWIFTEDINPGTEDAQVDGHSIVISPRVSGYVQKMLIDDNTVVKGGDLMIKLDPADYQAKVDEARAALQVAEAKAAAIKITVPFTEGTTSSATLSASAQVEAQRSELASAEATYQRLSTSELKFAEANIAARKAEVDKAASDVKRTRELAEQSEISKQQFDGYLAAEQVAQNEWLAAQQRLEATKREAEAAKAAEDTARARIDQGLADVRERKAQELQSGVRKADYLSALADIELAKASLSQAMLNLSYTELRAPMNATVTKRTVEPGQQFGVGQPMFTLVPLDEIWITANLKETQMAHVRPGQTVKVEVDTFGHRTFYGVVDSIASSTGSRQALLPPENATGNFVKVVQRIPVKIIVHQDPKDGDVLRPGMNVEVKIRTSSWIF